MSDRRSPSSEIRHRYPTYLQIGLLIALGIAVDAFTVDLPDHRKPTVSERNDVPIEMVQVDITQQLETPLAPAALPPPVEVENDVVVDDEVIAEIGIDIGDSFVPPGPPAGPIIPPAPPPVVADDPPPPPMEDIDDSEVVFEWAETEPEFIGGLEGLQQRVAYPPFARQVGIEGTVMVQFVVERNGSVTEVDIVRSPNELLSEAAAKAVRESQFVPGSQRGRAVRVRYTLPVRFVLR